MIRVAVVGASHWHLDLYLPTLLELPGVEVAGVSDPDGDVARRLGERLGCTWWTSYRELCQSERPDLVLVLGTHADMPATCRYLLEGGTAFVVEKPCGTDADEVRGLAELAASTGAFAAVPFVWRQSELLYEMRQRFPDEDVRHLSLRWIAGEPSRYVDSGCSWMLDPAQSGGGCTVNLSVHLIDLARVVLGDDVEVVSAAVSHTYGLPVEDWSSVVLRSSRGTALVETGYLLPAAHCEFDMRFSIRAREHYLVATGPEDVDVTGPAGVREHVRAHTTNVPHYAPFVRDVVRRWQAGQQPVASLTDMAPVMDLVRDAYAVAEQRREVAR